MTWTVWDVLVTVIGVLHIVGIVGVVLAFRRVVNGPVAKTMGRVGEVAEKGRSAAEVTLHALNANRGHVESIVRDVQGIAASVRPPDVVGELPISYRSLRNNLATLAMVRQGLRTFRSLGNKTTPPPGPVTAKASRARVSLPERLGLVPPAAKHLVRLLPYLRIMGTVLRQMKGR
jgi:hypothetical protein